MQLVHLSGEDNQNKRVFYHHLRDHEVDFYQACPPNNRENQKRDYRRIASFNMSQLGAYCRLFEISRAFLILMYWDLLIKS